MEGRQLLNVALTMSSNGNSSNQLFFPCIYCNRKYKKDATLVAHLTKVHNESPNNIFLPERIRYSQKSNKIRNNRTLQLDSIRQRTQQLEQQKHEADQRVLRETASKAKERYEKMYEDDIAATTEATASTAVQKCSVCWDVMNTMICLVPCGHTLCEQCVNKVNNCPTCRQFIQQTVKVYS
jgi:hypothetical protein